MSLVFISPGLNQCLPPLITSRSDQQKAKAKSLLSIHGSSILFLDYGMVSIRWGRVRMMGL